MHLKQAADTLDRQLDRRSEHPVLHKIKYTRVGKIHTTQSNRHIKGAVKYRTVSREEGRQKQHIITLCSIICTRVNTNYNTQGKRHTTVAIEHQTFPREEGL